jgi:hypothetical protein
MFILAKEADYPVLIEHMQNLLMILKDRPTHHRHIRTVLRIADISIRKGEYNKAKAHLDYCDKLCSEYDDMYNTEIRLQRIRTLSKHP